MLVYKHTETIECIKKYTFQEKYKLYGWITLEFLRLLMQNVQGIIFMWIKTYRGIFKSALVYL